MTTKPFFPNKLKALSLKDILVEKSEKFDILLSSKGKLYSGTSRGISKEPREYVFTNLLSV